MKEDNFDYGFEFENARKWYHKLGTDISACAILSLVYVCKLVGSGKDFINKVRTNKLEEKV
jgi:hypothetical protein